MKLASHPRLYVTSQQLARPREPVRQPRLRAAQRAVQTAAEEYTRTAAFEYPRATHNAHAVRAGIAQKRIVTLLIRYVQTRDRRFRVAVLAHVRAIGDWEYWSWITWRAGNPDPLAIYDLSYGENSATIAIAYNWLHGELSDTERALSC